MPLRSQFTRKDQLSDYSSGNTIRILIVIGGLRNSSYVKQQQVVIHLIKALTESFIRDITVTIATGKQWKIENHLKCLTGIVTFPLIVEGYKQEISSLMSNHDVLFSKPGGLIVSEALTLGMALIIMQHDPGQEMRILISRFVMGYL